MISRRTLFRTLAGALCAPLVKWLPGASAEPAKLTFDQWKDITTLLFKKWVIPIMHSPSDRPIVSAVLHHHHYHETLLFHVDVWPNAVNGAYHTKPEVALSYRDFIDADLRTCSEAVEWLQKHFAPMITEPWREVGLYQPDRAFFPAPPEEA